MGKNKTKNTTGFKMFTRPTFKTILLGNRDEWRVEFPSGEWYFGAMVCITLTNNVLNLFRKNRQK